MSVDLEMVIIDKEAGIYVEALSRAFPTVTFHGAASADAALDRCGGAQVVAGLAHEISDDLVRAMPKLRWIAALTTGTDHLDTLSHLSPDVAITSGRGIHGPQMAELAFYFMIGLLRDVRGMMRNQDDHRWERWPQRLLLNKTVVIVGVGAISEELAIRCKAFGMTVVGVSSSRLEARGFDRVVPRDKLHEAAGEADVLVALAPYTAETHHMIDDRVFAAAKPGTVFINIARGKVVDEAALIRHLTSGHLGGAGLDVFAVEPLDPGSPLWDMPNVILTPHIGGMSDTYAQQMIPLLAENLAAFLDGRFEAMRNVVRLGSLR